MSCHHHQQTLQSWDPHTDLLEETALHMDGCADCRAAFDHRFTPAMLPALDATPPSPPESLMPASTTSILPIAAFAAAAVAAAAVYGTVIHDPTPQTAAPAPITEAAPPEVITARTTEAVHTNHQPHTSSEPTTKALKATPPIAEALIGQRAPDIDSAVWFLGQGTLDDGKVTLLIFWDSTCLYCDDAMHTVEAWNQEMGDKGLNVLGLTTLKDSSMGEAYDYLEDMGEDGVSFPNAHDVDRAISDAYEVVGIPAAALVSDGEILWRGHPNKLDPDYLRDLLKD